MSVEMIGAASGEDKQLTLTLRDFPVLVCPNGHRQFPHAKFAMQLLLRLTQEDNSQLPIVNEKGLLFKQFLCTGCGAPLQSKADHRHTFSLDVTLQEAPKFGIELTLPAYRCSSCGKEQLQSLDEVRGRTPGALVSAFRAAGIESS